MIGMGGTPSQGRRKGFEEVPKALVLFSGGLDSLLAIKLLQEQNQEVEAVHIALPFTRAGKPGGLEEIKATAAQLGVVPHIVAPDEELAEIVAHPRFGHGRNFNPCQDCRIYQLRKAAALMKDIGADYLATGEVLGQRPMSQRREALFITDREAGLKGLVLRPLSAKYLPPTIPEQKGWVDRERLLDIAGRGRTVQEALARQWGLSYPSPAGGCLLTYRESAERCRNLLALLGRLRLNDLPLIGLGRHFRLGETALAVVGRKQSENRMLAHLFHEHPEGRFLLRVEGVPGPLTLVVGRPTEDDLELAASITARYADLASPGPAAVKVLSQAGESPVKRIIHAYPAGEEELARWRIG